MNSRRCIAQLLAIFVLFSNIGFALNVHSCGDKVASITIQFEEVSQDKEKDCCHNLTSKKKCCCKDNLIKIDKTSDNGVVKILSQTDNFYFKIQEFLAVLSSVKQNKEDKKDLFYSFDANAPPFFLLYSQFIFYA